MEILITSIVAFVSTNVDDIFILTLFYGNRKFKDGEILIGQYVGIISLITVSMIGALAGLVIDPAYIGILGLIPIYLGLKGMWRLIKNTKEPEQLLAQPDGNVKNKTLQVAGVTFANGGDNISIYVPLFATLTWSNKITMVSIFLIMTFLWCQTAKYFAKHPYLANKADKYGHVATPFVLVLLGIYIVLESETLALLPKV